MLISALEVKRRTVDGSIMKLARMTLVSMTPALLAKEPEPERMGEASASTLCPVLALNAHHVADALPLSHRRPLPVSSL